MRDGTNRVYWNSHVNLPADTELAVYIVTCGGSRRAYRKLHVNLPAQ